MTKTKKLKFFSVLLFLATVFSLIIFYPVKAEDDEEDDDKSSSATSSSQEATAKTDVKTKVDTVILKDSDGDGLLDQSDPHPDIPEIYIVEDANSNGIVDKFENLNAGQ